MAEEDYQRGLRGGPSRVTSHEYDRWSDWKAGYDEYERRLDREIEGFLDPQEAAARSEARYRDEMRKIERRESLWRDSRREELERDRHSNNILTIVIPLVSLVVAVVVGAVTGAVLKWLFGIPRGVTFSVAITIAILFAFAAVTDIRKRS